MSEESVGVLTKGISIRSATFFRYSESILTDFWATVVADTDILASAQNAGGTRVKAIDSSSGKSHATGKSWSIRATLRQTQALSVTSEVAVLVRRILVEKLINPADYRGV